MFEMSLLWSQSCGPGEAGGPGPLEGAAGSERNPLLPSDEPALEHTIWGQANASKQESCCS